MAQQSKGTTRLCTIPIRFKYLFLLATIFGGSFLLISINNGTEILFISNDQSMPNFDDHHYEIIPETTFTIKTEGCTIPGLTALDESIKLFSRYPKELKQCPNANFSLVLNNETHLWIDTDVFPYYNIPRDGNVSCYYEPFFRPDSVNNVYSDTADDRVQYETREEFNSNIEVAHEFVKVTCSFEQREIYLQFFIFARKKPFLPHSRKRNANKFTTKTTFNHIPNNTTSYYNVIIMGIDAISRLNFYRTMPKTLAYMKKRGAIELLGYNKVGDNTFPNLTPMLLGMKETELKKMCWFDDTANFDNCPFIWQWFKEAGYYTALGEDSASLGTFNFGKMGFIKSPTDYYMHTFINEAEVTVGNNKDYNSYICMGGKYFYQVLLDYIQDLTSSLRNSKLFGFFWEVTMSHDYLNYPMAIDENYANFLERLDSQNYLDNTVLLLLSDHGIRWGPIRLTKQGRLEERLPFVHILLPPSFRKKHNLAYSNLKQNARGLTTPFDIHATLMDLLNLDLISNENIRSRTYSSYNDNRSISLFLPISTNRTCEMAGIEDHWCTCHKSKKLSTNSSMARKAAKELVKQINALLIEYQQCDELKLADIIEVTEMLAGEPAKGELGWREFMVVVRTTPGDGLFEGTLRHQDKWSLAGTVSRLNLYGNQSSCVHQYQIKLYCYCKDNNHNQNPFVKL